MDSVKGTPPESVSLYNWEFAAGSPAEGKVVSASLIPEPDSVVLVPHRINQPNTPLWYIRKVGLESPKLLIVDADDGAQVYFEGTQVLQTIPNGFVLQPTADSGILAIRVLNNALKGGLKKAELIELGEALAYHRLCDSTNLAFASYTPFRDDDITLLVKPYIQRLREGQYLIKVESESDLPMRMILLNQEYSIRQELLPQEANGGLNSFLFNPSEPGTYSYYIQQGKHQSKIYQFKNAATTMPFAFTAWGDSQGGWQVFQELSALMAKDEVDFSIGLGDLVAEGSEQMEWLDFLYALQPLSGTVPIYLVPGNHDYDGYYDDLIAVNYHKYARKENYFAWIHNNSFFLALDPNERFPIGIEGRQRKWFVEQVNSPAWKNADWRFVVLHQPPYSQGWPGYHGDAFVRELIAEYAESAKINFVLAGHSHCYERLSRKYGEHQTHFLILGGAGGGLEPPESSLFPNMDKVIKAHHYGHFLIDSKRVELKIVGLEGEVLDRKIFTHE